MEEAIAAAGGAAEAVVVVLVVVVMVVSVADPHGGRYTLDFAGWLLGLKEEGDGDLRVCHAELPCTAARPPAWRCSSVVSYVDSCSFTGLRQAR